MTKRLARKSPSASRIFIVDDHPVFREGLAQVLSGEKDLTVCGEATNATQALRGIARVKPDLVLVDISLPGKSGLELIKELRSGNRKMKLLVVSMHDEAIYAARVLRAGGDGYIMKQEDTDELINAIRDVLGGHIYVSEEVLASLGKPAGRCRAGGKDRLLAMLTDPELEVLELLGRGKTNQQIARRLRLSPETIAAHCARIGKKLKLKNANELIRYAVRWVETEAP